MSCNNDSRVEHGINRRDDLCKVCGRAWHIHLQRTDGGRHYCPKMDARPSHVWPWRDTTFTALYDAVDAYRVATSEQEADDA